MLTVRSRNPVDYRLCNQTVTVYHKQVGNDVYTRQVYDRAFFEFKKTALVEKTGSSEASTFLLVIPGQTQTVFPGDKVLLGIGPEIGTAEQWREFIPSKVPNLGVVKFADPKYWAGQMVHVEAGG